MPREQRLDFLRELEVQPFGFIGFCFWVLRFSGGFFSKVLSVCSFFFLRERRGCLGISFFRFCRGVCVFVGDSSVSVGFSGSLGICESFV